MSETRSACIARHEVNRTVGAVETVAPSSRGRGAAAWSHSVLLESRLGNQASHSISVQRPCRNSISFEAYCECDRSVLLHPSPPPLLTFTLLRYAPPAAAWMILEFLALPPCPTNPRTVLVRAPLIYRLLFVREGYDGGDCCECTCEGDGDDDYTCSDFACIDPEAPCVDDDDITAEMVENCDDIGRIGEYP